MTIHLHSEVEVWIEEQIRVGNFENVDHLISEALQHLRHNGPIEVKHEALKRLIEEGIQSGPGRVFDQTVIDDILAESRRC